MEKRGFGFLTGRKANVTNEVYHVLIQLLIAVTVYFALQSYIDSIEKDTFFEKNYISKDMALLIDTIYGAPGKVEYFYANEKVELDKFIFDFKNQKATIREKTDSSTIFEYPYGEDLALPYKGTEIEGPKKIQFSKKDSNLEIKNVP